MGTLVRYERSWSPPRGVPCARRVQGVRRPDTYIPIPASGRTVPFHRSSIKLFYFLFSWKLKKGNLKGRIGATIGLDMHTHNRDLLISSQGLCCPSAVRSGPSDPRWNGLVCLWNIQWVFPQLFVVQLVSPGRIFRMPSPNCAVISGMVWFLQYQLCKGII